MALSMERVVYAMINAEFSDGLGMATAYDEMIYLDTPKRLRQSLLKAKVCIEFIPCGDVSRLKLNLIDENLNFSPKREIARACQQLLTMKAPHGKRRWGVGITPCIQQMLTDKTHQLIDCLYANAERAAKYYAQFKFTELEFSRYVGHLVSVAIQLLPSNKDEFSRIYTEIWLKRERDRSFPSNRSQKAKHQFHAQCIKLINELSFDTLALPVSSLTMLEPSGLAEIQKIHWQSSLLRSGRITSQSQQAAFRAFMGIKKMSEGRNDKESKHLSSIINSIIEDVEINSYWMALLNREFETYQQITCHDWSRLEGVSTKKVNDLIELLSNYVQESQEISLRMGLLRLLLPLVESWILCILLERKLKKSSITHHISKGLRELRELVADDKPALLDTFDQLKQFARPYGKGNSNG